MNAFGDTHINAFGDTHINAFGDTHINAFGDTHINAFWCLGGATLDTHISEVHGGPLSTFAHFSRDPTMPNC